MNNPYIDNNSDKDLWQRYNLSSSVSYFSGIGGFDNGLELVGFSTRSQVEIDPHCRKVLHTNFPAAMSVHDVKNVPDANEWYRVATAGFPCQNISGAAQHNRDVAGLAGEKSGLWFEFRERVEENQYEFIVLENVPNLLSVNDGEDFWTIISSLIDLGYSVAWRVLDARYFGVPSTRRRVFIIASLGSSMALDVLFDERQFYSAVIAPPEKDKRRLPFIMGWDGGLSLERLRQCVWDGSRLRKLTPEETEICMGFPVGWTSGVSDRQRYAQLRNSVVVPVAEWIASNIAKVYAANYLDHEIPANTFANESGARWLESVKDSFAKQYEHWDRENLICGLGDIQYCIPVSLSEESPPGISIHHLPGYDLKKPYGVTRWRNAGFMHPGVVVSFSAFEGPPDPKLVDPEDHFAKSVDINSKYFLDNTKAAAYYKEKHPEEIQRRCVILPFDQGASNGRVTLPSQQNAII